MSGGRALALEYYKKKVELAEASLAVERQIVVQHFAAFGAIMLVSAPPIFVTEWGGFGQVLLGLTVIAIAVAARAMSIYYHKYSTVLFSFAWLAERAYLRDRDPAWIEKRYRACPLDDDGKDRSLFQKAHEAETLSWREILTDGSVLASLHAMLGAVGLLVLGRGVAKVAGLL